MKPFVYVVLVGISLNFHFDPFFLLGKDGPHPLEEVAEFVLEGRGGIGRRACKRLDLVPLHGLIDTYLLLPAFFATERSVSSAYDTITQSLLEIHPEQFDKMSKHMERK